MITRFTLNYDDHVLDCESKFCWRIWLLLYSFAGELRVFYMENKSDQWEVSNKNYYIVLYKVKDTSQACKSVLKYHHSFKGSFPREFLKYSIFLSFLKYTWVGLDLEWSWRRVHCNNRLKLSSKIKCPSRSGRGLRSFCRRLWQVL